MSPCFLDWLELVKPQINHWNQFSRQETIGVSWRRSVRLKVDLRFIR